MDDKLRAAVYSRDKGICAFSGLSLWMLDYGTAPFSHIDWVDHIRPRSRGGKDQLENLVCASHFYNRKKMNNGSDKQYLFVGGKPTEIFYWTHGEISESQSVMLKRNQVLKESDWYFNRAIFNLLVPLADEYYGEEVVRRRDYWIASAWKRLQTWRRMTDGDVRTFQKRGLVKFPKSDDTKLLLSIADAEEVSSLTRIIDRLAIHHDANIKLYEKFLKSKSRMERVGLLKKAAGSGRVTDAAMSAMRTNNSRLDVIL